MLKLKNVTDRVLKVSSVGGRIDVHPGDNCLVEQEKAEPFLGNGELEIIPEKQKDTTPVIAKESDT